MQFKIESPFLPTGDQPEAIRQIVSGFSQGEKYVTLQGVTGSGKNLYRSQCCSGITTSYLGFSAQQNPSGSIVL